MNIHKAIRLVLASSLIILGTVGVVYADHAWGAYHWARSSNPLTLKLGDNLTAKWDAHLALSSTDWSLSSVLDTSVVPGLTNSTKGKNTPKNCIPTAGRVEVCNSKYGSNGWLGIASVWASGSHITQGTVKMNDTYFDTAKYNTAAWRNLVLCQEIGHTFGLDHQDENFSNAALGTCMDYTNDPTPNQHPNAHDYLMLETIYAHLDIATTLPSTVTSGKSEVNHEDPGSWGKVVRTSQGGRASLHERNLGNGNKIFTFVVWAD